MVTLQSCRTQLTAEDFDFVLASLSHSEQDAVTIKDLLLDEGTRDAILDHDKLYDALIDAGGCLRVSSALYFYVTVRRALLKKGFNDREIADYVASVLLAFADRKQLQITLSRQGLPLSVTTSQPYIADMLDALTKASHQQSFALRSHMGNYSLFLSGIFSERVKHHNELHGGPDIHFYEQIGQSSYHFASRYKIAHEAHLDKLFEQLAVRFHDARLALNDLTDSIFHLSEQPATDLLHAA